MSSPASTQAPLAGIRVLDLSTVVAGPFGSEILGYLGAEVIRIDSPSAAASPLGDGTEGTTVTDAEGFTWALQRNKRSIVLDLKSAQGKAAFLELVKRSDVVYENFRPGVMERLGLGQEVLAAANPHIVNCSISGFGANGPWATVAAYDAIVQALGGSMSITGTGEPADIPCRLGVPIGDIGGSLYAVIGVIASLLERARTGRGKALDISLLDVQLAMNTYRVPQTFGSGSDFGVPSPRRGGAGATPYGPFQCADGAWIVLGVASNFWPAFCRAVGREWWIDDPRFATLQQRQANQSQLERLVEERLVEDSARHWQDVLTDAGVPAARVNQIHEAFEHPQAQARQALVAFRQPGGRVVKAAANPVRWAGEAPFEQRAPVATGADTAAILAALGKPDAVDRDASATRAGSANDALRQAVEALACQPGPLAGTLVLEFCGDEPSGTLGTQIMADLGATVLKIERPPVKEPAPMGDTGPGHVRRDVAYAFGLNRNKRSVTLDLKSGAGRDLALRLSRVADVVYENHKPGVMARLGLGAEALREANPKLVVCSVSGYGQSGPWSTQPAYDATIQAVSGVMSITGTGRAGSAPVRWGNPIGGIAGALYAVIGVLASLVRRDRSGRGAWLDVALFDAQLALHAYRVPTAMSGRRYAPEAHRGGSGALPYGPFLAHDQKWFVLAITSQFWAKACDALDHPEWTDDPRFATEALRQANEVQLNALVGAAVATQDAQFWQDRFVARGIPGATALSIRDAFDHPQAKAREMLAGFSGDNPVARHVRVAGNPIRFVGGPRQSFEPVPGVGADAQRVLGSLLQLAPADLASLREQRVVWWPDAGLVYDRPSVV
jgi:crotonobetainyl-CoA:carnitine CoA-transferase CaiB-like acyl-CoA transferase